MEKGKSGSYIGEFKYKCLDCGEVFQEKKYYGRGRNDFCPKCQAIRDFEHEINHERISKHEKDVRIARAREVVRETCGRKDATIDEVILMAKSRNVSYGLMRSMLLRKGAMN